MGVVLVLVCAFLVGAIPFSNIAAHVTRGVDLREVHTGTVSGTALFRITNFTTLAVAGIFEVAKGAVGPLLAGSGKPYLAAIAGGMAVVGHNWSPFLRGAGGRGLSVSMGALLVQAWPATLVLLAALVIGMKINQAGLVILLTEVALVPVISLTYGASGALAAAAVVAPMMVKRVMGNHPPPNRTPKVYLNRLLFDFDEPGHSTAAADRTTG
jgi:acyl phosphate:glycerol-3-phosphate acyltransferase